MEKWAADMGVKNKKKIQMREEGCARRGSRIIVKGCEIEIEAYHPMHTGDSHQLYSELSH